MQSLSEVVGSIKVCPNQCALIFLGSFAPFHDGHLDVALSALDRIEKMGVQVNCLIFCLHNDSSVKSKIGNDAWGIDRRLSHLTHKMRAHKSDTPFIVNDLTCRKDDVKEMTLEIIKDVSELLKIKSTQEILIMGSDNASNISKYIDKNRVICVNRPGYKKITMKHPNLTVAERRFTKDISSTKIRDEHA